MQNLLKEEPVFTLKENGFYVMEINDQYYNIDSEVKLVMQILSKSKEYSSACKTYNEACSETFSEDEFTYYSTEIRNKFQLEEKKKSFLLVEKLIISPKVSGKIANLVEWSLNPVFFWFSISFLVLLTIYITYFYNDNQVNNEFSIPVLYSIALYMVTVFFHEIGHIAACKRFTGKNGGMGVGIYLVYPVFFSNISSIWHATKQQKVIANLAGVYMQLLFMLVFFLVYLSTGLSFLLNFSKFLIFICFVQLLPFIRSDGYWLLNDLFGVHNLMEKSNEKMKEFLRNPFHFFSSGIISQYLFFLYGISNLFFVVYFAYYQIRYNYSSLLSFPKYIWELLKQLFTGDWGSITFDANYLSVLLFYFIMFSYSKNIITKFSQRKIQVE